MNCQSDLQRCSIIGDIVPKLHASEYNKDPKNRTFVMATEDLSPGFGMMDFGVGLTPRQAICAMRKLAQFHALSFAYTKLNNVDLYGDKFGFLSKFTQNIVSDAKLIEHVNESIDWIIRDLEECEGQRHLVGPVKTCIADHGERFRRAVKECPGAREDIQGNYFCFVAIYYGA